MKHWIEFFQHEAPRYLENDFTRNTVAEVDFIERELASKAGETFLDIGCGTGRHSIELASRGYRCTGIDQSPDMLRIAQQMACERGVDVEFVRGDASETRLDRRFDHVICLCEGAFSLVEPNVDAVAFHQKILENIRSMTAPGGNFLLTALNAFRIIRTCSDEDARRGRFDPLTLTTKEDLRASDGSPAEVVQKGFTPAELTMLLDRSGFDVADVWGGTAGSWNKSTVKMDEMELMVICRRRE